MAWLDELMGALSQGQGNPNLQDLQDLPEPATLEQMKQGAGGLVAGMPGGIRDLGEVGGALMGMSQGQPFPVAEQQMDLQAPGTTDWFGDKMGMDVDSPEFIAGSMFSPDPFGKVGAMAGAAIPLIGKVGKFGDEIAGALGGTDEVVDATTDLTARSQAQTPDFEDDILTTQLSQLEANALPEPTKDLVRTDFIYNDEFPDMAPGTNTTKDMGRQVQQQAVDYWGGAPMEHTPENIAKLHDNLFEEAYTAYKAQPEVAEWYKNNLKEALGHAEKVYPEIKTDPGARSMFLLTKAITSNGQQVTENSRWTKEVFDHFRENGRFPEFGKGKQSPAMKQSFATANELIDDMGVDGFSDFLRQPFTKKQLADAGYNVNGLSELMDFDTHGSIIFGPKIGGGFFQNLDGNFDPVTFDMWWTRTWGRHTGTAMKDAAKQRAAFRGALADDPDTLAKYGVELDDVMKDNDLLDQIAGKQFGQFSKDGFKDKTPTNNAARNLKARNGINDDPGSGSNRAQMRQAVQAMQGKFKERGIEMDNAAIQALLWYVEKDLYKKMGVRGPKRGTDDYASAWKEISGDY